MSDEKKSWQEYYQAVAGRKPHELFTDALKRFDGFVGTATDLGYGSGIETVELLSRGWQVTAIDKNPEAIALLKQRIPKEYQANLQTQVASFEQAHLPRSNFIWAGLSLPFCAPEHFDQVWANIVAALRAGGRFAGDLFGPRCTWATNPEMTFHAEPNVQELLRGLEVEYLNEAEGETQSATQGTIWGHRFRVIARKPSGIR